MKIGELARQAGTNPETIRYYEREGLLQKAGRSDGNYRIYSSAHLSRLNFIRRCRNLDMTLDEIHTLLHYKDAPQENCGEVNRLLDEHIEHVARRITELRALESELQRLRDNCNDETRAASCGILNGLSETPLREGNTDCHVSGTHRWDDRS